MKRIVVVKGDEARDASFIARLVGALRDAGCEVQECGPNESETLLDALAQGGVPVVINGG